MTSKLCGKTFTFPFYAVIPKQKKNLPFFIHINFRSDVPDRYMPTEEIIDNGFAVFSFGYQDVTSDGMDFTNGLAGVLYDGREKNGSNCGKIPMWSWAASRIMDYCQTLDCLDFSKSAVVGHSRLGKTALYTGMITDSGRFRYDSTSAQTMRCAAFLLEHGVDTNEIYRQLYASDFDQLLLRAQYTLKIRFTPRRTAYIYTTGDELKQTGADEFTISRGMVSVMSDIRGVDIWVNFTETDRGVLCELRSSRYNINPIAVKYGGGGHAKASGATLPDRETAMAMLADLDALQEGENG